VAALGLVNAGEPAQRRDDIDAVTVPERPTRRNGAGELLEFLGCRFDGHSVESDEGV
jgi:hypothetical protein